MSLSQGTTSFSSVSSVGNAPSLSSSALTNSATSSAGPGGSLSNSPGIAGISIVGLSKPQDWSDLNHILGELRSKDDNRRLKAADGLRGYISHSSRSGGSSAFEDVYKEVVGRLFALVNSNDLQDKLAGVTAIDQLLILLSSSKSSSDPASKAVRLATFVQKAIPCQDAVVMSYAAKVFAKLAGWYIGHARVYELVEVELNTVIEWLQGERIEMRRYASSLLIRELSRQSQCYPLIYDHLPSLLDNLWTALRDPKVAIRECASDALSLCLWVAWDRDRDRNERNERLGTAGGSRAGTSAGRREAGGSISMSASGSMSGGGGANRERTESGGQGDGAHSLGRRAVLDVGAGGVPTPPAGVPGIGNDVQGLQVVDGLTGHGGEGLHDGYEGGDEYEGGGGGEGNETSGREVMAVHGRDGSNEKGDINGAGGPLNNGGGGAGGSGVSGFSGLPSPGGEKPLGGLRERDLASAGVHKAVHEMYQMVYDQAQKGFRIQGAETVHGSLLGLKELLVRAREFMQPHFLETANQILAYKDHREALVRRAVIELMPILANFNSVEFANQCCHRCMIYLLSQIKKGVDRSTCYYSIGHIASAMKNGIVPFLDGILDVVTEGLASRGRKNAPAEGPIFECISKVARALKTALTKYMSPILDLMFAYGLSVPLKDALTAFGDKMPPLLPVIQERLLNLLAFILSGDTFKEPGGPANYRISVAPPARDGTQVSTPEQKDPTMVILALQTLSTFNFEGHSLHEFARDTVVIYLEDDSPDVRGAAAECCCSILKNSNVVYQDSMNAIELVREIIEKLLTLAIADPEPVIRLNTLKALPETLNRHLAQAEHIRSLFVAVNDEIFQIRELAVGILGRIADLNPAYIMPPLRQTLLRLLTELEYSSIPRSKEESATLLGIIVRQSGQLTRPYVVPMIKVLLPKGRDSDPHVSTSILMAIGHLAKVGGRDVLPMIKPLMELIVDSLQNQSSLAKRNAALVSLGQLAAASGYVIQPYLEYKSLLGTLIHILSSEANMDVRRDTVRTIGILGALDPYRHTLAEVSDPSVDPKLGYLDPHHPASVGPSHEDYYPTVTFAALLSILRDPSLANHHTAVVEAIMYIFRSLRLKCVTFLPQVIPAIVDAMQECQPTSALLGHYFEKLGQLIVMAQFHVRNHLTDVFRLIHSLWSIQLLQPIIIDLIGSISIALESDFRTHLPNLLPLMLSAFEVDLREQNPQTLLRILAAFASFGSNFQEYIHLALPVMVKTFERNDALPNLRKTAITTVATLCRKVNISDQASRVIHPLVRVLDGPVPDLRPATLDAMCALMIQMGPDFALFVPTINKAYVRSGIKHQSYDSLVSKLLAGEPLPQDPDGDDSDRGLDMTPAADAGIAKLPVNQQNLKSAWEPPDHPRPDEWKDWLKRLSVQLLKSSPSHCLRACANLAEIYNPLARELFNAAFVSCWGELYVQYQDELVRAIEIALASSVIPPEITQTLLNLAEFMEHDDKVLPIESRILGAHAQRCHAWAKALHYKEIECMREPNTDIVEDLIRINNFLQMPDVASGILNNSQQGRVQPLREEWYEKLDRWEDALESYVRRSQDDPESFELAFGQMRCYNALGDWEKLSEIAQQHWSTVSDSKKKKIAPYAAAAAWSLANWDEMEDYITVLRSDSSDRAWLKAILHVHRREYAQARKQVNRARDGMIIELSTLLSESYSRAYTTIVRSQMLAEIEEIIEYKSASGPEANQKREDIRKTWMTRLVGCRNEVDVWQKILKLRSTVLGPEESLDMVIKYANLCRRSEKWQLAEKALSPYFEEFNDRGLETPPQVIYSHLKLAWDKKKYRAEREDTLTDLKEFTNSLTRRLGVWPGYVPDPSLANRASEYTHLLSRAWFKIGEWQTALQDDWGSIHTQEIMKAYMVARDLDDKWAKAQHNLAVTCAEVVNYYTKHGTEGELPQEVLTSYLVPAIEAFFRAIALSGGDALQDTLRLLTLWFNQGDSKAVNSAIAGGFGGVSPETWLTVVPQLIARIQAKSTPIRKLVQLILTDIGKAHPQALVYPLTVASKYPNPRRKKSALAILDRLQEHSSTLVSQALIVSSELIRVAILWHEQWHEGLEEASRLYYNDNNIEAMFEVLEPLHDELDKGAETLREHAFVQTYGRDLHGARLSWQRYRQYNEITDLNQAWDLYYGVFRKIVRDLSKLTTLELQSVSPKLLNARDLELAVPGTYQSNKPVVSIKKFQTSFEVMVSKQRPRKLKITGSDGVDYQFLLKGHEDLRQDERVMQAFDLFNSLFKKDTEAFKRHLNIRGYPVIPLSPNSGLLGWVPNTDTFHHLVKNYRESRKVLLNIEHRLMLQMAPDYDNMYLMQKIEVFEYALENTTGQDLYWVLWLKSRNSEAWLVRRSAYSKSLAAMSMVGYLLGLGDRHPANLLMDRGTGRIVHVDFGDCFEVAMKRPKYPETVPFRLTRMLVHAMEISGAEGTYKINANITMRILRENDESILAMLEAFAYDPLVNWRLVTGGRRVEPQQDNNVVGSAGGRWPGDRPRADEADMHDEDTAEQVNAKAVAVIRRIRDKLAGKDFNNKEPLDVQAQVQKLCAQALSYENLCQLFTGWCPFW